MCKIIIFPFSVKSITKYMLFPTFKVYLSESLDLSLSISISIPTKHEIWLFFNFEDFVSRISYLLTFAHLTNIILNIPFINSYMTFVDFKENKKLSERSSWLIWITKGFLQFLLFLRIFYHIFLDVLENCHIYKRMWIGQDLDFKL